MVEEKLSDFRSLRVTECDVPGIVGFCVRSCFRCQDDATSLWQRDLICRRCVFCAFSDNRLIKLQLLCSCGPF